MLSCSLGVLGRADIIYTEDLHGNFEGRTEEQIRDPYVEFSTEISVVFYIILYYYIHSARIYI
jgi:hypothetical protein